MAEEKSKKSIVLADDSDDDEYASEKYSEQTELSSILDKLSLGPEKKKKKLLILSPNGLLLYRVHVQNLRRKPENRSPDATCGPNLGNITFQFYLVTNIRCFMFLFLIFQCIRGHLLESS